MKIQKSKTTACPEGLSPEAGFSTSRSRSWPNASSLRGLPALLPLLPLMQPCPLLQPDLGVSWHGQCGPGSSELISLVLFFVFVFVFNLFPSPDTISSGQLLECPAGDTSPSPRGGPAGGPASGTHPPHCTLGASWKTLPKALFRRRHWFS